MMAHNINQPWTSDPTMLLAHRVLGWANEHPGANLPTSKIAHDLEVEQVILDDSLQRLASEALVQVSGGSPIYMAVLTAEGVRAARSQREEADTRSVCLAACSDALLDWLSRYDGERNLGDLGAEGSSGASFTEDVRAHIFGVPFLLEDVQTTTKSLVEYGLVNGFRTFQGATIRLEITQEGRDVILDFGGSVRGWRRSQRTQPAKSFTFNFGDSASGVAVAVNSPGATQTVSVTQDHRQQLVGLADAFEQVLPVLGLSDTDHHEARTIIGELREADPEREPGKVRRLLQAAGNLAVAGTGNAAGTGIVALIQQIAEHWPS